jgi:hypothetical protein
MQGLVPGSCQEDVISNFEAQLFQSWVVASKLMQEIQVDRQLRALWYDLRYIEFQVHGNFPHSKVARRVGKSGHNVRIEEVQTANLSRGIFTISLGVAGCPSELQFQARQPEKIPKFCPCLDKVEYFWWEGRILQPIWAETGLVDAPHPLSTKLCQTFTEESLAGKQPTRKSALLKPMRLRCGSVPIWRVAAVGDLQIEFRAKSGYLGSRGRAHAVQAFPSFVVYKFPELYWKIHESLFRCLD